MILRFAGGFFIFTAFAAAALLSPSGQKIWAESLLVRDIPPPAGFSRMVYPKDSFMTWLTHLPLKNDKRIIAHDGREIRGRSYNVFAVIDMPLLFKADLEQCADFCMRFWAEYHREAGRFGALYLFDYGGTKRYYLGGREDAAAFQEFLRQAFAYSNSWSLLKGCAPVPDEDVRPGDMFVQNETGGIGHVSMILDACKNDKGEKLFLVGFSFMPAQEFHIEKAAAEYGRGGWFTLDGYKRFLAEYYRYGRPHMRRF